MPEAKTQLECKLLNALRRIAAYDTPAQMRRSSWTDWGVDYEECLEMAYENLQREAKRAVRGIRKKILPTCL
jgi:hypothetical protein